MNARFADFKTFVCVFLLILKVFVSLEAWVLLPPFFLRMEDWKFKQPDCLRSNTTVEYLHWAVSHEERINAHL